MAPSMGKELCKQRAAERRLRDSLPRWAQLAGGCLVTPILALGELAECVWLLAVGSPVPSTTTS